MLDRDVCAAAAIARRYKWPGAGRDSHVRTQECGAGRIAVVRPKPDLVWREPCLVRRVVDAVVHFNKADWRVWGEANGCPVAHTVVGCANRVNVVVDQMSSLVTR